MTSVREPQQRLLPNGRTGWQEELRLEMMDRVRLSGPSIVVLRTEDTLL